MTNRYESVACGGMDVHYKFSTVTWRDESGGIVVAGTATRMDADVPTATTVGVIV